MKNKGRYEVYRELGWAVIGTADVELSSVTFSAPLDEARGNQLKALPLMLGALLFPIHACKLPNLLPLTVMAIMT